MPKTISSVLNATRANLAQVVSSASVASTTTTTTLNANYNLNSRQRKAKYNQKVLEKWFQKAEYATFEKYNEYKVKCLICETLINVKSCGITGLKAHLNSNKCSTLKKTSSTILKDEIESPLLNNHNHSENNNNNNNVSLRSRSESESPSLNNSNHTFDRTYLISNKNLSFFFKLINYLFNSSI
jgi:hypothetical protein